MVPDSRMRRSTAMGTGSTTLRSRWTEAKRVNLGLRQQDADLFLEDAEGNVLLQQHERRDP